MKPFIAAEASPAELEARRKMITKGMRMYGAAYPGRHVSRAELGSNDPCPPEQRDLAIGEIVRRLRLLKDQLDASTQTIKQSRK